MNVDNRPYWHTPGGGVEARDKSLRAAAFREIYEETGMEVAVYNILFVQEFVYGDTIQVEFFFRAIPIQPEQFNPDHQDPDYPQGKHCLKWFNQLDLEDILVLPARVSIAAKEVWLHSYNNVLA